MEIGELHRPVLHWKLHAWIYGALNFSIELLNSIGENYWDTRWGSEVYFFAKLKLILKVRDVLLHYGFGGLWFISVVEAVENFGWLNNK